VEHVDELIPAHAIRALDADDERMVEEHVAGCERCRRQLAEFESVAASLAYAAPPAAPPPDLRSRILAAVEPVVEVPTAAEPTPPRRRRRSWWPRTAQVAAPVLAAIAVALALWNVSLRNDLSDTRDQLAGGTIVHLANVGNVVTRDGRATLYSDLSPAPEGKTYQAWVIRAGTPLPAGTFAGGRTELHLSQPVVRGDTLAVTIEPAGGSPQPTTKPIASGRA
jgi:anti-sigma-K factor RskA